MKIRSIEHASLLIASIVTGVVIVAGTIVSVVYHFFWWALVIICASTFLLSFLISRWIMKKFVIYKIKPIYQIVYSRNIKTRELEDSLLKRRNLLEVVSDELSNWAETNQMEIARLKENERYRKEYLGNVSHEIKTPIFNVQGYISTLLDGGLEDETINRKYLERAEKSIDRLINIVHDLDEISKLESGVLRLDWERFDIVALAREIVDSLEIEADTMRIALVVNWPNAQTPLYVRADRRYIGQVFVNLLTNSIRYGRFGGRTKISFIDMFDKVMVEVADNGEGIAQENIPRVFERFYRTDKSRSRAKGGTGLGLSIVKHIMEAHGESITLRSEIGRGSTFSFTLSKI